MILIAYDGSDDAKFAIDRAGELFTGSDATVVSVWEPFIDVLARSPSALVVTRGVDNVEEIDKASREAAEATAEEGAKLATTAGLNAQARADRLQTNVSGAILAAASHLEASAIVIGSRGLTRVKSLLLGSVSSAVIQHTDRPVVLVPSREIAKERARSRRG
jgi:nucleotide-binding universal stress UspA family protein